MNHVWLTLKVITPILLSFVSSTVLLLVLIHAKTRKLWIWSIHLILFQTSISIVLSLVFNSLQNSWKWQRRRFSSANFTACPTSDNKSLCSRKCFLMEKPVINFCLHRSFNNMLHTGDICGLEGREARRNVPIYIYIGNMSGWWGIW